MISHIWAVRGWCERKHLPGLHSDWHARFAYKHIYRECIRCKGHALCQRFDRNTVDDDEDIHCMCVLHAIIMNAEPAAKQQQLFVRS